MTSELFTTPPSRVRRCTATALGALALTATAACGSSDAPATTGRATVPATAVPPATPATTPATPATAVPVTVDTVGIPATPPSSDVTVARPAGTRDELIEVGDARVHLRCEGSGGTTVVLVAGFGDGAESWAAIEPALAERTRVCSYDRPGTGASPASSTTETFESQATQLDMLLATAGEPGPYVLVGHSFGGAAAASFAVDHPDVVEALVLVDASPTGWATSLCSIADDGTDAAEFIRGMCASWTDPTANPEHLDVFTAFDELGTITSLGAIPVTVLTADHRELPADTNAAERARLDEEWQAGQERWAALSTDARLVTAIGSGHYVQLDQPSLVLDEIVRRLP